MRVLVAEDDPVTLETVSACLREEGYTVVGAVDGREALERWRSGRPDLLCLDIMMPGLDGFEVCRRVRKEDAAVPILFLSAKNEEVDVVVGLELGADDFVRKPFGKRELLARVRAALRRRRSTSPESASFDFGDWSVFPAELRAERGGVEVELSPREVAILTVLRERIGEAVTRDTLHDHCWGLDYYPESRTLDQHIAKLRKKIDPEVPGNGLIETVRGLGYRLRRP